MPENRRERQRHLWLAACLAGTLLPQLVGVNDWPRFPSPNERARAYQALAVATRGSLSIDAELERFGSMEDVARSGDRRYPNKAPGLLPVLVPAALLARLAAPSNPAGQLRITLVAGRWLAASLPLVLSVLLLVRLLVPRWPRGGPVVVTAWAVASPALPAGLLLFAHAFTSLLVLVSFALLFDSEPAPRRAFLAGAALGWAVCCEYQLAVVAAVLAAVALPRLRFRGTAGLAAGAVIPALSLALYNAACFGSPLSLSSAHEAAPSFAALARHGVFGISWPTLSGLSGLLVSPDRGLLVYVPIVLAGALGVADVARRLGAGGAAACVAVPAALVVVMSGYANWHGGWFPGPRYILATVPLLLVPAAAGAERLLAVPVGRVAVVAALTWGWLAVWPISAAFPFPPVGEPFPSLSLGFPFLADGALMPSWLPRLMAAGVWAAAACTAAVAVLRAARAPLRECAVALAVVVVLASAAARARRPTAFPAALARAVAHDVYAGGSPGWLEALRARYADPAARAAVDAWIARRDGGAGAGGG